LCGTKAKIKSKKEKARGHAAESRLPFAFYLLPFTMMSASEPRILILETSGRIGQVALARGEEMLRRRRLDETRRHARDLVPAVAELLTAEHWQPKDVQAVIVSRGPGSYTGLRVGIISAKTFAYVTGCAVLAVDTFTAIAQQAPAEAAHLDVLADAQQEKIYLQSFARLEAGVWAPTAPLRIQGLADWLAGRDRRVWVTGPGLQPFASRLPEGTPMASAAAWDPQPESVLKIGLARYRAGERDDPWTLDPLYLRPSSAEEKWRQHSCP
jgi:tRNA threonylcarbamoyladenosine biosynthesis protein TsaB